MDADGDMDVIGASYYDSTVRWFENDGKGNFSPHIISRAVSEGQGVTVADLDNDGDLDIVTASSGDNTVAVFKNLDRGVFCEIKEVVDDDAIGVRTVVASDLDGDGWLDLASASKDDHSVSWYPNDGAGSFPTKILISAGSESEGAYSLVAIDIDGDNDNDLIVASNGNDHVSLWRNNGKGNFTKTLIYDNADFVLSVTAVDFDRDGDLDVASASFFDGYIRWYENMDGVGSQWKNHTLYVGIQGHYVSHADLDGDGDDDLIAVTHAENTVAIFLAKTNCDFGSTQECCAVGKTWNGSACVLCSRGTYGVGSGIEANCKPCPTETCTITGSNFLPATCSGITDCANPDLSIAACACLADFVKHSLTDTCIPCPQGQRRPSKMERSADTLGNYTAWEQQQGVCTLDRKYDWRPVIYCIAVFVMLLIIGLVLYCRKLSALAKADAVWIIPGAEITYDQPTTVLGQGSFGVVSKGYYRGTPVAVKKAMPKERPASKTGSGKMSPSSGSGGFAFSDSLGQKGFAQSVSFGRNGFAQSGSFGRNGGTSQFASLTGTIMKNGLKNNLISEFAKEMRIVAKLRHPCITTVMGAVLSDEPLLVMEYMGNGSMRELLSNETFPFDPELSLPLIRDILEGMRFLHAAASPIIHGDLKTANVLVDENFRAKIADFGLSSKRKVRFVGTPFWMAPELLQGANISRESDVYAFGVTLWEVMTRKVPYADSFMSSDEILEKVKMGEMRPNCDSGLETELVQCMQDCWAQQPEKRSTLNELALKLIPLCGQNFHTVMQTRHNAARKQRCLLEDVFPEHIAKALLAGRKVEPEHHDCVTVYFCDIVGFTTLSSTLSPQQVSEMLDRLYTAFDSLAGAAPPPLSLFPSVTLFVIPTPDSIFLA